MKLVDVFNLAPGYKCREGQQEQYFEQKENCQHQHKGKYSASLVMPKVFWVQVSGKRLFTKEVAVYDK